MVEPDPEGINTVAPATYTPPPRGAPLGSPFFDSVWSKLRGKPYITVSAKGIANGLSDIPNDGADFGPDTPGTTTTGIAEALLYAESVAFYDSQYTNLWEYPAIKLSTGLFYINEATTITLTKPAHSIIIEGQGQNNTRLIATSGVGNNNYAITITGTGANYPILQINDMSWYFENGVSQGMFYWSPTGEAPGLNLFNIENGSPSQKYMAYFGGSLEIAYVRNIQNEAPTPLYIATTSTCSVEGGWGVALGGRFELAGTGTAYVSHAAQAIIDGDFYLVTAVDSDIVINTIASPSVVSIIGFNSTITINTDIPMLSIRGGTVYNQPLIASGSSTVYNIGYLYIDNINFTGNSYPVLSNVTVSYLKLGNVNNSSELPLHSSTNGTTAGTVSIQATEFTPQYKKYIITFSGYENDTTTNQTIDFPNAFGSYAVITANNTGLTISATTSGITITTPDSTTTYSGIVIVEGY